MSRPWENDVVYRLRHATITEPPSDGYPTNLGHRCADLIESLQAENDELKRRIRFATARLQGFKHPAQVEEVVITTRSTPPLPSSEI